MPLLKGDKINQSTLELLKECLTDSTIPRIIDDASKEDEDSRLVCFLKKNTSKSPKRFSIPFAVTEGYVSYVENIALTYLLGDISDC